MTDGDDGENAMHEIDDLVSRVPMSESRYIPVNPLRWFSVTNNHNNMKVLRVRRRGYGYDDDDDYHYIPNEEDDDDEWSEYVVEEEEE